MYWLQDKENLKSAKNYGFGKDHLKCKDIGHIWIPQFDNETWDMHKICFNCGIDQKDKKYHVYKLPSIVPIRQYAMYNAWDILK